MCSKKSSIAQKAFKPDSYEMMMISRKIIEVTLNDAKEEQERLQ